MVTSCHLGTSNNVPWPCASGTCSNWAPGSGIFSGEAARTTKRLGAGSVVPHAREHLVASELARIQLRSRSSVSVYAVLPSCSEDMSTMHALDLGLGRIEEVLIAEGSHLRVLGLQPSDVGTVLGVVPSPR